MKEEKKKYEELLTTIANTRLVYNTMNDLEDMLDNHSIHNNGIKRCFTTLQKLRSVYRDIKGEVSQMTNDALDLDIVLADYQQAWTFFRSNLFRRSNPESVALELLAYCCPPYIREGITPSRNSIYQEVIAQHIDLPFLLLMILKAIPGYDSKDGDVENIDELFDNVMQVMEKFASNSTLFNAQSAIGRAREEENRTRLTLYLHVSNILYYYQSFVDSEERYDMSNQHKQNQVQLDIAGFWNECGGKLEQTKFWQIEDMDNYGCYRMTLWEKKANNQLLCTRHTLFVSRSDEGNLVYYMHHPEAVEKIIKGEALNDNDHVWYQTPMLDRTPSAITLTRLLDSGVWREEIPLTRCTDETVTAQYERWMNHDCKIVNPFSKFDYRFNINLYAVTPTHLYIPTDDEGEYYKVPKSSYEGFGLIQMTDSVGTVKINGKTYLAFDEFLLFISTDKEELDKYGITIVNTIE